MNMNMSKLNLGFLAVMISSTGSYANDYINTTSYTGTFNNSVTVDAFGNEGSISAAMLNDSDGTVQNGMSNSAGSSIGSYMENKGQITSAGMVNFGDIGKWMENSVSGRINGDIPVDQYNIGFEIEQYGMHAL